MKEILYDRLPAGDLLYQFDVVHLVGRAFELLEEPGYATEAARLEVDLDLRRYALGEFSPAPPRAPDGAAIDVATLPEGAVFQVFSIPLRREALPLLRDHLETLRALRVPVRTIVAIGSPGDDREREVIGSQADPPPAIQVTAHARPQD